MRKRISCIIALLVMLTASGCGSKSNVENGDNSSNVQQEEKDTTNVDNSQVTEKKDENIKNPQDTEKTTEDGGKKKEEEQVKQPDNITNTKPVVNNTKPTPAPTTKPKPTTPTATPETPTPNPKPPVEEVKIAVNDIMNRVTKEVELPSMINLKKEEMKDFYYINPDDVEDFIIKVPMMNVKATEVAIIKVKDVKNVENVKESINKRVKDLERTWERYLPDQYELVKNHIIKSNGQYVIFIINEDAKKIEGTFDSFFKK